MKENVLLGFFQRKIQKYQRKKLSTGVKKNAYLSSENSKDFLIISRACCKLTTALLGKENLITAFVGSSALSRMECLRDCGFVLQNEKQSFFSLDEGPSMFNLLNPISDFNPSYFDIALLIEPDEKKRVELKRILKERKCLFFDLEEISNLFRYSLNSIQEKNFLSCLNLHKLAIIMVITYLCPDKSHIAEIGSYQCGTTIFMAKLLQHMKKESSIYAFDTFAGMPPASSKDRNGVFCFDQGMFVDNDLKKIKKRLTEENVSKKITLSQGLVQNTLPHLLSKNIDLFFAFIDTDQYLGTMAGLENVLSVLKNDHFLIVVDDPIVEGVNKAINETLEKYPNLMRKPLFTNFELIFSKGLKCTQLLS